MIYKKMGEFSRADILLLLFFFKQIYNLFPWFGKLIKNKWVMDKSVRANREQNLRLVTRLKETLNPQVCRGFVDAFLVRKHNLEVG